jgi:hypothetical protein
VKTRCNLAEYSKESYGSKRAVLPTMITFRRLILEGHVARTKKWRNVNKILKGGSRAKMEKYCKWVVEEGGCGFEPDAVLVLLTVSNWKILRLSRDYENRSFDVEFQQYFLYIQCFQITD